MRELFTRSWVHNYTTISRRPDNYLRPGSYIAVLEGTPFIEPGLDNAEPRMCRSIVYGIMKGLGDGS